MLILIVRIALTALAVGFLAWLGYVLYLGLKNFFDIKSDDGENTEHHKKHNK